MAPILHAGNSCRTVTVAPGVPTDVTDEAHDGAVTLSWTALATIGGTGHIG